MKTWRTAGIGFGAVAAAAAALWLASPGRAAESVTETRAVGRFERVSTNGFFKTHVVADSHVEKVTVSGDPAVVSRVTTAVSGDTLEIGLKTGTNLFQRAPLVTIEVPLLRGYANQGAGSITIAGVHGDAFSLSNAGTAAVTASGHVDTLDIALDGVGKIDTVGLDARDVTVDNNGVGRVDVRASGTLTASVNGVGEVRYAGNPAHVDSHVNGVGRIGRL